MQFRNRSEAGQRLAGVLEPYKDRENVLVLALPRGGVPVGYEVARTLNAPFDIFLVRKLGVPGQEELAMGAIASGGIRTLNSFVIQQLHIPPATIEAVTAQESDELLRREQLYRGAKPSLTIANRIVILVDDGLATGSSMRAAVAALRLQNPAKIVVAVPVAPEEACHELRQEADEVVCLLTPDLFSAVGLWYDDFNQTSDAEVTEIIRRAA